MASPMTRFSGAVAGLAIGLMSVLAPPPVCAQTTPRSSTTTAQQQAAARRAQAARAQQRQQQAVEKAQIQAKMRQNTVENRLWQHQTDAAQGADSRSGAQEAAIEQHNRLNATRQQALMRSYQALSAPAPVKPVGRPSPSAADH